MVVRTSIRFSCDGNLRLVGVNVEFRDFAKGCGLGDVSEDVDASALVRLKVEVRRSGADRLALDAGRGIAGTIRFLAEGDSDEEVDEAPEAALLVLVSNELACEDPEDTSSSNVSQLDRDAVAVVTQLSSACEAKLLHELDREATDGVLDELAKTSSRSNSRLFCGAAVGVDCCVVVDTLESKSSATCSTFFNCCAFSFCNN